VTSQHTEDLQHFHDFSGFRVLLFIRFYAFASLDCMVRHLYVFYMAVRPSVRCQNCEQDNLKTNEPILLQVGSAQVVHEAMGKYDRLWGQKVKGQGHTTPKFDLDTWRRHRHFS